MALFEVNVTDAVGLSDRHTYALPMRLYVVNTRDNGRGGLEPNLPTGIAWVGDLYTKNAGVVSKYVLKSPHDIVGLPGVFGPITQEQIEAAIEADGGTLKGWKVPHLEVWALDGVTGNDPRVENV